MADRYGYVKGKCYICKEEELVRCKNLYTIGSEGTDLCINCEMIVVKFVRDLAVKATQAKIKRIKQRKIDKDFNNRCRKHGLC